MTHKSDIRLLREYADHGDEAAFTELVSRHRDLVYSAAARQTSSPDLAGDVAQNVFTILARGAPALAARLAPEGSLAGWLCRCTRNVVLNLRRGEFRRQTRERKAMEEYLAPDGQPPEWEHLGRVLDEAMAELGETDHEALVLRFFKNQDLRAVGQALGLSDDSAQKRVSRALDKLRERLSRRGLATTTTALAVALSAHAIQAAPAGFIITLPTAATLAAAAASGAKLGAAFQLFAMTTLQKGMLATALVAALGAGLFEARQAARLQAENRALIERQTGLARDLELARQAREAAVARATRLTDERAALSADAAELLRLRGEVARLRAEAQSTAAFRSAGASINDTAKAWVQRVAQLQTYVKEHPEEGIPELKYLTDREWLVTVDAGLDTPLFEKPEDFRHAIHTLKSQAESRFGNGTITPALRQYAAANGGAFPADLGQLTPYLKPDDAALMLDLYEIRPSSVFSPELMKEFKLKTDWVITRKRPFSNSRSRLAFFLTGHAYWQAPEGE